ncbi:MAG: hypothetical protein M0D55_10615 [Elusimicrobiota bacterium]|nr:MAG: hypothetical protein M0D55_10615 [Elusimicrobiota bacterium]
MRLALFAVLLAAPAAADELARAFAQASASAAAPKPAPRPVKRSETGARFQQKEFPAPAAGACGIKRFTLEDFEHRSAEGSSTARASR